MSPSFQKRSSLDKEGTTGSNIMAGTSSLQEREENLSVLQSIDTGSGAVGKSVFRSIKIKHEKKKMLFDWHFKDAVITAEKLAMMSIYHEREVSEPRNVRSYISEFAVRIFLKDENMLGNGPSF